MKKLIYIFIPLILLSSLWPTINYSRPAVLFEITLQSAEATTQEMQLSKNILVKRLQAYGIQDFEIVVDSEKRQLAIRMPDRYAQEPILPLLISKGELSFCETYSRGELAALLNKSADQSQWQAWLPSDPQTVGEEGSNAIVAFLEEHRITGFFQFVDNPKNREALPENLHFSLGRLDPGANQVGVYALRCDPAILSGEVVKSATPEMGPDNVNAINLVFSEAGVGRWAEATRRNINRSIAIVIDNQVYAAPRVMAEIRGGKAMITGDFSREEARLLAAILSAGTLPVELEVMPDRR